MGEQTIVWMRTNVSTAFVEVTLPLGMQSQKKEVKESINVILDKRNITAHRNDFIVFFSLC